MNGMLEGCLVSVSRRGGLPFVARWLIACVLLAVMNSGCQPALPTVPVPPKAEWDAAGIQDFSLTDRTGKTITKQDLLGKQWIVGFIFTRCAGPCPRVTAAMTRLQKETGVQNVTITVDPDHDTPEILERYAEAFAALEPGDEEKWYFLTGDKKEIYDLIINSFKMPVQELEGEDRIPGFEVIHSVNIMHVNAEGRVVGKYNALKEEEIEELKEVLEGKPPRVEVPAWVLRLPAINASLNGTATVLLLIGYVLIKLRKTTAHKYVMLLAFCVSVLFLGCYLVYHYHELTKKFPGEGLAKTIYLIILATHVILAMTVPVLAPLTIYRGLKGQWEKHRRIARVTFPIWLYVSVTGVIIYGMLYHWPTAVV